jgi:rhodanese-related sulfurtransferase
MDPRLLEYVHNHLLLVSATVTMALVVVAYELRQRANAAASISPASAVQLLNGGAVLLDVRSTNQFKDGHISGARNVPGDEIAAGAAALEKLKDKTVIACCENGITSAAAARKLKSLGFGSVYNLRGGLSSWRQDNLPVVKG